MNSDFKPSHVPKLVKANSIAPSRTVWGYASTLLDENDTGGACAFFQAMVPAQSEVPTHNREAELLLIESGHFQIRSASGNFELKAGDFALLPAGLKGGLHCRDCAGYDYSIFYNLLVGPDGAFEGNHPDDKPKIIRRTEGECLEAFGQSTRVIVASGEVGNRFCLVEVETPPLGGSRPHIHQSEDRTFFIRAGRFEFCLGDARILATAGDIVFAPRGIPQSFRVLSAQPARFVLLATPGGYDDFVRETARIFAVDFPSDTELGRLETGYGVKNLSAL